MAASETITASSGCGTQTLSATLMNPGGTEISQICSAQIGNSTCNGGSLTGMQKYSYEAMATLLPCANWVFSWTTCCRNVTVNVPTSTGDGSYLEATLNSTVKPCNVSPEFFAQPIPSVCINQPVIYNLSASNNDGDSLVYSFIAAKSDATTQLVYSSPYSATNPINGISINSPTGTLNFTPSTLGNFIVAVQISEYNSSGILIGTVMRDIQFMVVSCTGNSSPNASSGTITGLTGTAVATGSYALQLCSGGNFSFNIQVGDNNAADTVLLTSDIASILPGASFSSSSGNPASAVISWSDTGSFTGTKNFTVTAKDNVCPVPGIQTFVYTVTINNGTYAWGSSTICGNQQSQLNASGGSIFQWTVLSGDSIVVGTNFSCNPCSNPLAGPDTTTSYLVTSNISGACANKDTVVVSVVPGFTFSKTQSKTSICLQEQVQFLVTATGSFSYQWSPSSVFNNAAVNNPIATFFSGGTKTVYFTITNSSGCSKTDSMTVVVSQSLKPDIVIVADTTVCAGSPVQMNATIVNTIPSSCGLSSGNCQGSPSQITVGTGLNLLNNTTYPSPYGNWYMGAKHQLLFTASELNSLGFQGGQITSIALNVSSISGTTIYKNFEIKMGCTPLDSLTAWQNGLVTVLPAQTVNIIAGWNFHTFSNGFDWDGTSNIIVEFCFNNQPDTWTNNSPTFYTPTSFNSVIYYNADNSPMLCSSPAFATTSINRPNVLFSVCSGGSGNSGYSYAWSPVFGLNNPGISNPVATINNDTSYNVIVADTIGGCSDTASINLHIVPNFTYVLSQSDSAVCEGDSVMFSITPNPQGNYFYDWSPDNLLNDTSISNPAGIFDSAGTFKFFVEISSEGGCSKMDSATVNVAATPLLNVTGDAGICKNDSSQLLVTGGNNYSWLPSNGLNNDGISNPKASPSSTTMYTVSSSGANGCNGTADFTVNVFPLPIVNLGGDTSICASIILNAGSGFVSYLWSTGSTAQSINASVAGTYTVAVKDSMGCTNKDTIVIYDSGSLAQITNAPDTICITDNSTSLSGTPSGGNWFGLGISSNGIFNPGLAGTGLHNIIYLVSVNGCTDADTVLIFVDSCLVGINYPEEKEMNIKIFPNPNEGKFSVLVSPIASGLKNIRSGIYDLEIFNIYGEVVYKSFFTAGLGQRVEVDLLKPGQGIYFLRIAGENLIAVKKILIN